MGYSPWGLRESDTTDRLTLSIYQNESLSLIHILLVLFLWRLLTVYTRNTYLYLFIYLYIENHEFM